MGANAEVSVDEDESHHGIIVPIEPASDERRLDTPVAVPVRVSAGASSDQKKMTLPASVLRACETRSL
jgi:hypothetical protein